MRFAHRQESFVEEIRNKIADMPRRSGVGRRHGTVWLFALVALLSSVALAQLRPLVFSAELSGDKLPNPVATDASGMAMAVLVGNQLTITGSYQGLSSPMPVLDGILRGANVRLGEGPAVPLIAEQFVLGTPLKMRLTASGGTSGIVHGVFTLTGEQVQELQDGQYYVQLYSEDHPVGELRGQLVAEIDSEVSAEDWVGIWQLEGDEGDEDTWQFYADGSLDHLGDLDEANNPEAANHSWSFEDNIVTIEIETSTGCAGVYTFYEELLRDGRRRSYLLEQPAGGCATAKTWQYYLPVGLQ